MGLEYGVNLYDTMEKQGWLMQEWKEDETVVRAPDKV
jgi:hypothetical protein